MQVVRKPWGKERIPINTDLYCAKIITYKDNLWSSGGRFHYHKKKDETFRVLRGRLQLAVVNGDRTTTKFMTVNDKYRIPRGMPHRFRSDNCMELVPGEDLSERLKGGAARAGATPGPAATGAPRRPS